MTQTASGAPARRPRLLLYAMYDATGMDSAPKVRITMLGRALAEVAEVTWISGTRGGRLRPALRWLLGRGWRSIDAVYVEASTSTAAPWDLLLLGVARLAGKPIGVYFRDAYWRFRDLYPARGLKVRLLDAAMRVTHPILRRLATIRFVPSRGLGDALGLPDARLLPPGTDPSLPDLGPTPAAEPLVTAVISPTTAGGLDLLYAAMALVRERRPDARLRLVSSALLPGPWTDAPWLEVTPAGREGLEEWLAPARVCVIPLPRTAYTDLAAPVRAYDLIAFGKPIVATATDEMVRWFDPAGAALLVADEPVALADGILRVIGDDALASRLGRAARALAERDDATWGARARTIVEALLPR